MRRQSTVPNRPARPAIVFVYGPKSRGAGVVSCVRVGRAPEYFGCVRARARNYNHEISLKYGLPVRTIPVPEYVSVKF